jgi:hypothetical protein
MYSIDIRVAASNKNRIGKSFNFGALEQTGGEKRFLLQNFVPRRGR